MEEQAVDGYVGIYVGVQSKPHVICLSQGRGNKILRQYHWHLQHTLRRKLYKLQ